jgi:hypothetical protein
MQVFDGHPQHWIGITEEILHLLCKLPSSGDMVLEISQYFGELFVAAFQSSLLPLSMSCPSSSWLMKRSRKKIDLLMYLSFSANSFLSICLQISVQYK